ncbi:MAG: MMPL family transporter [Myxococcota bacterium]|nr:MMPL family transporter [Myxococcota bacterium]
MGSAGPGAAAKRGIVITRLNEAFAAIAGWSFDHRWWVLGACVLLLAGSVAAASKARIDNSYEAYFDPADPAFTAYEQFREDFGSDEVSYILYEAPGFEHGPWNLEVMRKVDRLTEALEDEVPFVYQVTSLASAELTLGVADGIDIQELRDDFPETQEELLALRAQYMAKPMLVGGIVSEDAEWAAIIIEMDLSSTDPLDEIRLDPEGGDSLDNLYPQVTDTKIEEILARPEYEGLRFFHSGDVPLNAAYNNIIGSESGTLDALTSLVIAALLLLFFRSFVAVVGPLVVVQTTILLCVAFVALLGWKLDMSFGTLPTLLTALGVAHSVHILSEFRGRFAELGDRREALVQTLYLVGTPCLLTSLTTAAGFLSMSFVPIKSIAHMAVYSAFGVLAAFVLSLTLLMALLSFGRRTPKRPASDDERMRAKGGRLMNAALLAIAEFDVRHRVPILVGFGALFLFSLAGISRLVVDSNWLDDFSYDVPLKAVTEQVDAVMGGVTNVIYLFDTGEPDGIKDPAVLREIERVQQLADQQDWLVRKTYSIVDILKDLNQAFHEGDPAWYRIPETRELVAQYLLLYEMSGGEETEEYVSSDFSRASLELRLALASTSRTAEVVRVIDTELEQTGLERTSVSLTGIGALWLKLMDYIVSSQIQGFLIAFGVIAAMMCLLFRSFKTGLISMVPNLSPVVLTLGIMGWAGIPLDYNKIMIAAVAIGIAVDDTIHLLSRYHHEFRVRGDYREALRAAVEDVGRALFITSAALVCGFMVFTFSVMASTATFGVLLAWTIVVALVADFLLMPALVLTFHPFGPEGSRAQAPEQPILEAA